MIRHCTQCGWSGTRDQLATGYAEITGAMNYKKITIALSACPACAYVGTSIKRPFATIPAKEAKP
jgi:hypothetical protein